MDDNLIPSQEIRFLVEPEYENLRLFVCWGGVVAVGLMTPIFVYGAGWWGFMTVLWGIFFFRAARFNFVREMWLANDGGLVVVRKRGSVRVSLAALESIERRVSSPRVPGKPF